MKNNIKIIDLGMHPYADTFVNENQLNKSEPVYPLSCYLDKLTGMIYNSVKTNQDERYNLYEYSYTSSNSKISKEYWKIYAKEIMDEFKINSNTKILEIGSNDGYLLKQFKKKTKKILGIDASAFMCRVANEKKIKTINCIFNKKVSSDIVKKYGKFDIIIANNVLNHANNPFDFVDGVNTILSKKGKFIFELPYWYNLISMKKFDQIYHEHVSYMTVKSSFNLLKKNKLEIFKIKQTSYHGGSIRVFSNPSKNVNLNNHVKKLIDKEEKLKLFETDTYLNFMKDLKKKKFIFLRKVLSYKLRGYIIIGIGAAAKANTFLNFIGLDNSIITYITDSSKYKIGKYTPLTRIPIYSDNIIKTAGNKICAIPLAWNIGFMLQKKLLKVNKNIKFINF